jgi:hypothetical protein
MINTPITNTERIWNTFEELYCSACLPGSDIFLHSTLDQGWKVIKVELTPSWDQYGFLYLVTLEHQSRKHYQQLILPKTSRVENLLHSNFPSTDRGQDPQPECA